MTVDIRTMQKMQKMQKSQSTPDLQQECLNDVLVKERIDLPNFNAGYNAGTKTAVYNWESRAMPTKHLTFTRSDFTGGPKLPSYQFRVKTAPNGMGVRSASVSSFGELREGLFRPHYKGPMPGLSFSKIPGFKTNWPEKNPLMQCHPHHLSVAQSLPSDHQNNNKALICDLNFSGNQGRFPFAGLAYRRQSTSPRYKQMRSTGPLMECSTRMTSLKGCRSVISL